MRIGLRLGLSTTCLYYTTSSRLVAALTVVRNILLATQLLLLAILRVDAELRCVLNLVMGAHTHITNRLFNFFLHVI